MLKNFLLNLQRNLGTVKTSWTDEGSVNYHLNQFKYPKRSTIFLELLLEPLLSESKLILDIGCGAGAVTIYLARNNPSVTFVGLEKEQNLLSLAEQYSKKLETKNVTFNQANMFRLNRFKGADGVLLVQVLSWVSDYEKPLNQVFRKVRPKWIAVTALFYEGDIDCYSTIIENTKRRAVPWNTYSLPRFNKFVEANGYKVTAQPFNIDINIDAPTDINSMSTYTIMVSNETDKRRIQVSGPMLQSWYTVLLTRE